MNSWIQSAVTVLVAVLASSGFWTYLQKRTDYKDARSRMILGLGHSQIIELCLKYLDRGWITQDEYENLYEYLYKPYTEMGGNGTAKKMMREIDKLPIHPASYIHKGDV